MLFAPDVMPGALEALGYLRTALARGCFSMWGRASHLEFDTTTRHYCERILNDADEFVPHALWLDDGRFHLEDYGVVATAPEIDAARPKRPGKRANGKTISGVGLISP
jgi:hypothetical protein